MGYLNTAIIRLLLDCTLYLSALESEKSRCLISNSLNIRGQGDLAKFYADHVSKDINILSKCLQHSPEESMMLIHHLLSKLKNIKTKKSFNSDFKTIEQRLDFENYFSKDVVSNLIGDNADKIIQEATNKLRANVKESGSNQLFRIAHDLLLPEEKNNKNAEFLNNRKYW